MDEIWELFVVRRNFGKVFIQTLLAREGHIYSLLMKYCIVYCWPQKCYLDYNIIIIIIMEVIFIYLGRKYTIDHHVLLVLIDTEPCYFLAD